MHVLQSWQSLPVCFNPGEHFVTSNHRNFWLCSWTMGTVRSIKSGGIKLLEIYNFYDQIKRIRNQERSHISMFRWKRGANSCDLTCFSCWEGKDTCIYVDTCECEITTVRFGNTALCALIWADFSNSAHSGNRATYCNEWKADVDRNSTYYSQGQVSSIMNTI